MAGYGAFSGPFFPVFKMNIGIYGPRKTSVLGHFSPSECFTSFKKTIKLKPGRVEIIFSAYSLNNLFWIFK